MAYKYKTSTQREASKQTNKQTSKEWGRGVWVFWRNLNPSLRFVNFSKTKVELAPQQKSLFPPLFTFQVELTPEQKALFPELTDLRQQIENLQVKYLDVFGHCCFSRLVTAIFDVLKKFFSYFCKSKSTSTLLLLLLLLLFLFLFLFLL